MAVVGILVQGVYFGMCWFAFSLGIIFVFPIAYSIETMQVQWTGKLVATLAYLVIRNSILAMTLLLAMIRAGEVSRVSALLFLVPPLPRFSGGYYWVKLCRPLHG